MLVTLVPLFDKELRVCAYSLFVRKNNNLLNPTLQGIERFVEETKIDGLEVLDEIGIDTLSPDTPVFMPMSKIAIFSDIASMSHAPHDRLVLFIEENMPADQAYIKRLTELKQMGYGLAVKNVPVTSYVDSAPILSLMDYIFLDSNEIDVSKGKLFFEKAYPNIKICVGNIRTKEYFDVIKEEKGLTWFEGEFYRVPVTVGDAEVSPLKSTYLQLLNVVNKDDFELTEAADVIGRDTALTISFLKMVNTVGHDAEITSIRHAAAMMGQREMKKWINAVVAKELCADRPSEVMRASLLRAKFAEQMAANFEMATSTQELFLVGLFSVLDLILECPMKEALAKITVAKEISDALIEKKGRFAPVLDFIERYEAADWQAISRMAIVQNLDEQQIYDAYIHSARWYRNLLNL